MFLTITKFTNFYPQAQWHRQGSDRGCQNAPSAEGREEKKEEGDKKER